MNKALQKEKKLKNTKKNDWKTWKFFGKNKIKPDKIKQTKIQKTQLSIDKSSNKKKIKKKIINQW